MYEEVILLAGGAFEVGTSSSGDAVGELTPQVGRFRDARALYWSETGVPAMPSRDLQQSEQAAPHHQKSICKRAPADARTFSLPRTSASVNLVAAARIWQPSDPVTTIC